jgi:hypothetical protein
MISTQNYCVVRINYCEMDGTSSTHWKDCIVISSEVTERDRLDDRYKWNHSVTRSSGKN